MSLYIDIGNSALKWRWRTIDACVEGGASHCRDWQHQIERLADGVSESPTDIYVASVAGRDQDALIASLVKDCLGVSPRFYYSSSTTLGVSNCYAEPGRLGVDRWLAVVEAWNQRGASMVIDCGSAITLDAVDTSGQHHGGYIVPGLRMLETSLTGGTGSVRVDEDVQRSVAPGRSTSECVRNGILRMSVSFITDAMVALQQSVQDTCSIFITGGDASTLKPYLPASIEYAPELVLDGLERVVTTPAG